MQKADRKSGPLEPWWPHHDDDPDDDPDPGPDDDPDRDPDDDPDRNPDDDPDPGLDDLMIVLFFWRLKVTMMNVKVEILNKGRNRLVVSWLVGWVFGLGEELC